MKRNLIISIISTLLILLWAYAALSKWAEFRTFGFQLQRQPLPDWSKPFLKWGLPIVEVAIAVLIFFQRTRLKGLLISSFLMIVFTLYVLFALSGAFGEIPCSCAGLISTLHWKGHLVFNIFFSTISITGAYLERHKDDRFVKHKPVTV